MPTSVKSLLSRLSLVKLVRVDSCWSPASPTPAHKTVGVDDARRGEVGWRRRGGGIDSSVQGV